ncbi:MAG: polysaccharide biosynthesis C-terminal domain-containing protein [Clostridia bacterium]|nr:polysaccharide biosynthesis C-terminal domain-containing protein [Clostridia bacterium]
MNRKMYDMTQGKILPVLLTFAIPMMLGALFQDLYNLVDMTIAGYTLGDDALAAISATSGMMIFINSMSRGFNIGNAILVSNSFGAGGLQRTRKGFAARAELCIAMAVTSTVLLLLVIGPLLRLISTPDNLFSDAKIYIVTIISGITAAMLYDMFACAYRAVGNSKTPLYFLILSSLLNMVLDYVFMVPLAMGVRGAALATIVSQAISAILSGINFYRSYPELRIRKEDLVGNGGIIREMLPIGFSSSLTNSVFAIGTVAIQGAVNALGAETIIAQGASRKIQMFAYIPSVSIANTIATFSAQNYGAKKIDRISKGIHTAILFSFCCNIVTFTVLFFFGGKLTALITNTQSAAVIKQSETMLRIIVPFIFCQTAIMSYRMSIQGMQRKIIPIMGTFIELIIRCVFALVITPVIGYVAIAWAEPASWITSGLSMLISYYVIAHKESVRLLSEANT